MKTRIYAAPAVKGLKTSIAMLSDERVNNLRLKETRITFFEIYRDVIYQRNNHHNGPSNHRRNIDHYDAETGIR